MYEVNVSWYCFAHIHHEIGVSGSYIQKCLNNSKQQYSTINIARRDGMNGAWSRCVTKGLRSNVNSH